MTRIVGPTALRAEVLSPQALTAYVVRHVVRIAPAIAKLVLAESNGAYRENPLTESSGNSNS